MQEVFNAVAKYGAVQNARELEILCFFIKHFRLNTVLELGLAKGGTFYLWSTMADPEATLISIDLPCKENEWIHPETLKQYKTQTVKYIRGNTHDPKTLQELKDFLGEKKVDMLFIDADHSYDSAKKDYEMYSPLVKVGGIIGFHDINFHEGFGIERFYEEIKKEKEHLDIILTPYGQGLGLGVIIKDK